MISLRYHVVSLAAFFLALAIGVVLGSTTISDRLLSGLHADRDELGRQVDDLQAEGDRLRAQLAAANTVNLTAGPRVVRETLTGRSVVLVSTADADPADRDALTALLRHAGATVTGELRLTDAFSDPARADQLSELATRVVPAGAVLPITADGATLTGGLLGSLLLVDPRTGQPRATPAETTAGLAGLGAGGFLGVGPQPQPAQLAVVLTGGAASSDGSGDRAGTVARFAAQLDRCGAGAVLAGRPGLAAGDGPVEVVRADPAATAVLSTVDDVSTAAGRVATVLALAEQAQGRAGRYGTAADAQAALPEVGN